jgi:hypothetical protein
MHQFQFLELAGLETGIGAGIEIEVGIGGASIV